MSKKIFLTGFKPFLNETINPSEMLTLDLEKLFPQIEILILPVEFKQSFEILKSQVHQTPPDVLIMLGQATDRKNICFEKIALNWIHSANSDETGKRPPSGYIDPLQPLALMSKFPIEPHFAELRRQKMPVEISFSAGTFVCNDLYFRVLCEFKNLESIFIHLPLIEEQSKNKTKNFLTYQTQLKTLKTFFQSIV